MKTGPLRTLALNLDYLNPEWNDGVVKHLCVTLGGEGRALSTVQYGDKSSFLGLKHSTGRTLLNVFFTPTVVHPALSPPCPRHQSSRLTLSRREKERCWSYTSSFVMGGHACRSITRSWKSSHSCAVSSSSRKRACLFSSVSTSSIWTWKEKVCVWG